MAEFYFDKMYNTESAVSRHYDDIFEHNYKIIKKNLDRERIEMYCTPLPVCAALIQFFHLPENAVMTRTSIVTRLYQYIDEHNLVDGTSIRLNDPLKDLFNVTNDTIWRYSVDVYVDDIFDKHN